MLFGQSGFLVVEETTGAVNVQQSYSLIYIVLLVERFEMEVIFYRATDATWHETRPTASSILFFSVLFIFMVFNRLCI